MKIDDVIRENLVVDWRQTRCPKRNAKQDRRLALFSESRWEDPTNDRGYGSDSREGYRYREESLSVMIHPAKANGLHSITFGRALIEFRVQRSQRKTLAITVQPSGAVIVTAPRRVDHEAIGAERCANVVDGFLRSAITFRGFCRQLRRGDTSVNKHTAT